MILIATITMLTSIILLIILLYKKDEQKSIYLSFLAMAICFYMIGNFLEISSSLEDSALAGFKIRFIGAPFIPTIWYLCVREFCGMHAKNKVLIAVLTFFSLLFACLAYTWDVNRLLFTQALYSNSWNVGYLELLPGPLHAIWLLYQYSINLLGIFTLVYKYRSGTKGFKKQAKFFFLSGLIPFFSIASFRIPFHSHQVEITPYALGITFLFFSYALYRFGILNFSSMIKNNAINHLYEGVLLFDRHGIYMESNNTARNIFPEIDNIPLGTSIDEMEYLPFDSSLLHHGENETRHFNEFTKECDGIIKTFNISVSQISFNHKPIGYSIILNNISSIKKIMHDLEMKAIIDPLTGIYNRGYLFEVGEAEVEKASQSNEPLSVILFDLDHFKNVNDTCGHVFGDYVLKTTASISSASIRKSDLMGRYGGEEFCIVLRYTTIESAYRKAEAIRAIISSHIFENEGHKITMTASFGVSEYKKGLEAESFIQILKRADENLYKAKEGGRNRVE